MASPVSSQLHCKGFMDGAVRAGERAAAEICAALQARDGVAHSDAPVVSRLRERIGTALCAVAFASLAVCACTV